MPANEASALHRQARLEVHGGRESTFSAGNAQNMEPPENVLPLFERLGYNP